MEYKYCISWKSKLPKLQGKEEEIMKLHIEDKISVSKLSEMYECSRKPIQRIIKNNGGTLRPSTSPELDGREEEIIKMYVDDELTIETIRKKIGCTFNPIKRFLQRNGIPLRSISESRRTEDGRPPQIAQRLMNPSDLEDAVKMYKGGEVLQIIGDKYGITPRGLTMKFKKLGVKMRTLTESANLPATYERKKITNLKNWGVENPLQSKTIYDRVKATNMERYGVESVMQDPEIFERAQANAYKFKTSTICGKIFKTLQGYEPQGIRYLIEHLGHNVNNIHSGKYVPKVPYQFQNEKKVYFPDIFVDSENLLVEVKCEYTYEKELEQNITKREAAIKEGYNFLTIIFDRNGKDISRIF